MLGVRQWRHVAVRHEAFCVSRQHRLCRWPGAVYVVFMKVWCVYLSSVKQCLRSVNHEQFPVQMTQNSNHNKWLEILAGDDFPPKLLGGTPPKIHREGRKWWQQETARQRVHRLVRRRQRRQHSDYKHVQKQRQSSTIALQTKPMKGGYTDCRCFKKRWGEQATLEVYSQNYLLRCNDRQLQEYLSNGLKTK